MRRRNRRLLNLFAFLFLGTAIYLNMFLMEPQKDPQYIKTTIKKTGQDKVITKIALKDVQP